jgi:hypothetical protein
MLDKLKNFISHPVVTWLVFAVLLGISTYLAMILYNLGKVIWWLYNITKPV